MRVAKIVCHDGQEFFCRSQEKLSAFIKTYRERNEDRIRRDYLKEQFLVHHIEAIEMTEEEYNTISATTYPSMNPLTRPEG